MESKTWTEETSSDLWSWFKLRFPVASLLKIHGGESVRGEQISGAQADQLSPTPSQPSHVTLVELHVRKKTPKFGKRFSI